MNRQEAEDFTRSLGKVMSGGWELSLQAWRLGVPQALEMTHEAWVREHLGGYVRLSIEDRRQAVAELTEEGMSTRQIGEVLGVDQSTVVRDANASPVPESEAGLAPPPDASASQTPDLRDTEIGCIADADADVRRHRAMHDFMAAVSKTAALLPQLDHIVTGVLEVDAEHGRAEADRALATWKRVAEALSQNSQLRRVK